MTHDTQRIRPAGGDLSTFKAYQARYGWREPVSEADRNDRQCWWGLAICIIVGVFAAAVLVALRGCR
jgi:hypothetical protein